MTMIFRTLKRMEGYFQEQKVWQKVKMKSVNHNGDNQTEVQRMILGCQNKNGASYKWLYQHFYSDAMGVCVRYSSGTEEAKKMLNDGFVKVFANITQYDASEPFKRWLFRIMIDTAIDNHRENLKYSNNEEQKPFDTLFQEGSTLDKLSYYEILKLTQRLNPIYRIVFSMHVIDGFSHQEIARKLNISVADSKSSLLEARENLKKMVTHLHQPVYSTYS